MKARPTCSGIAWRWSTARPIQSSQLTSPAFCSRMGSSRSSREPRPIATGPCAAPSTAASSSGTEGRRELEEHQVIRLKREFNAMVAPLTVGQKLALTDLALDLRPRWLRAKLLGLPLDAEAVLQRQTLLSGLDVVAR
jgi:hypothetical protein